MPNVSFCEDTPNEVHYNPYEEPFFCKLTLNDDSVVNIEGSGELTSPMTEQYRGTCVSAEIGELCTSLNGCFYSFPNLESLTIPRSVSGITSLGAPTIIAGCTKLEEITFNASCPIPSGFCNSHSGLPNVKKVVIGDGVTSIGSGAFQDCTSLSSVRIGSGVTSIGSTAFAGCSGLTKIEIPNTITSIDGGAFQGCTSLSSVTVEATTPPTLESNAFEYTNNCPIYVPSGSVEVYKTTSGWSAYASRIQAIQ